MTLTYRPALADLIHAARMWEANHWKIANRIVAGAMIVFGALLIYVNKYHWSALFIFLGVFEFFNLLPAAVIRACIEWQINPKFREEYQLSITREDLHFKTPTIDSTLKWTYYSSYLETSKAFILIYGKRMYTVIPKRVLSGPAELDELRAIFKDVIKDNNNKKRAEQIAQPDMQ